MTAITPLAATFADLLRALRDRPGATNFEIGEATGRVANNLARDLGKLAEAGLVDSPADRRLTPAGVAMVEALDRAEAPAAAAPSIEGVVALRHEQIRPDPLNPRKFVAADEEGLAELADSIAQDGLLEPLVVRPGETDHGAGITSTAPLHRLIAGERRWRAIRKLIGDNRWPADRPIVCTVKDIDDAAHRRIALVENLQRKDLRPIDEANALKELMAVTGQGTAEVAQQIGFTQRFVQQRLQLLDLDAESQDLVNSGTWTIEQARRSIASRPKPLSLKPAELLQLAEIGDFLAGKRKLKPGACKVVGCAIRADDTAQFLAKRGAIYRVKDWGTGHDQVQINELGVRTLLEAFPDFNRLKTDSLDVVDRVDALGAAGSPRADGPKVAYLTSWLNEPHLLHPEEVARKKREQEQVEERKRREAEDAETRRQNGEEGQRMLASVLAFEAAAQDLSILRFEIALRDLLTDLGFRLPFTVAWGMNQPLMEDAGGKAWAAPGPALEALRRLMAICLNYAAGCPAVSGPALTDAPWAQEVTPATDPEPGDDDEEIPRGLRALIEPAEAVS
jgi:ParB/RepB/Spo0J family partition protein